MNPERWSQVKNLLATALEQPNAAARASYLSIECEGQTTLRRQVEDLLDQTTNCLETSADGLGSKEHPARDPNVGRRVGAWTLGERLGAGGMGTVYLARRADGAFDQTAAVKLLRRGTDTEEVLRRFRDERQILARLDHPSIVRLLDGGATDDGLPFFVLEHVDGQPVTVRAHGLSPEARLRLFLKICAPVQYAHERLIVHRDLKPGNILVTAVGEEVKLLDFGIAKLLEADEREVEHTLPGQGRLTPAYASPEQARGEPVTVASDVYALGALLYELLVGRSPHRFRTVRPPLAEIARVVGEEPAMRPSVAAAESATRRALRGDLDNILLKALEKEPGHRYHTVNALAADVRRHLDGLPIRARRPTWRYRTGKFLTRNRWGVAAGTLVVFAVTGGMAGTLWQARRAERRFADVSALAHSILFEFQDSIRELPGSTAARQLLVTRALEYLQKLERETGGDTALRRELAAAYIQVGDVQGRPYAASLGDTAGARTSYRRAVEIVDTLPSDKASDTLRADAWEALSNLLANGTGERAEAKGLQERVLATRVRLAGRFPDDPAARRALAKSNRLFGDLLLSGATAISKRPEETRQAETLYLLALGLYTRLHVTYPGLEQDARNLALVHYRLGNVYHMLGMNAHNDAALLARGWEHHRQCVALREEIAAAHPASAQARNELADALTMKSGVQTLAGDPAGALADCRRGIELLESLSSYESNQEALAYACFCISIPERALGDLTTALAHLDRAISIYEVQAAADPCGVSALAQLNNMLRTRVSICKERGDADDARTTAQRWVLCVQKLLAATPDDDEMHMELVRAQTAAQAR